MIKTEDDGDATNQYLRLKAESEKSLRTGQAEQTRKTLDSLKYDLIF